MNCSVRIVIAYAAAAFALISPPTSATEDARYFARDQQTELTLTPADEAKTSWEIELRQYRPPGEPQEFGFIGTLTPREDHLECVESRDDKQVTVRVKGAPAGESISVETTGLEDESKPGGTFDGSYQRLSPEEQITRAKERFAAVDTVLNSTYQEVRAAAGKNAATLRKRQRDWLEHRDSMATHGANEKPETTLSYWETMRALSVSRIEFLSVFNGKDVPKGLSGVYTDGYGGELQLEEKDGRVEFDISVVRGPTFHIGDLSGAARRNGGKLIYKEEVERGEDRAPAELTFTLTQGHVLEVKGKNTSHHHGARAFFDGTYYKTRKAPSPRPES